MTTDTTTDDVEAQGADDTTDDRGKVHREAQSLRARLRAAESERDTYRSRAERADRADVERAAERIGMVRGADVWDAGVDIDSLRDDAGDLDDTAISAAVDSVLAERPHWKVQPVSVASRPVPALGGTSTPALVPAHGGTASSGATWSTAMREAAPPSPGVPTEVIRMSGKPSRS